MSSSILVLGAGELGMAVLRGLAKHSLPSTKITALLRPSTVAGAGAIADPKVAELRRLGVDLLPGDLASAAHDELVELLRPFDTVIGCTGFVSGRATQLALARAVLAAGVSRYVPWQFGVDYDAIGRGSGQDLFDEQLDVRNLLRSQDETEWIIVSTGMFTSFLFEPFFGLVQVNEGAAVVRAPGSWETEVTVTCPEDIGDFTARIVSQEPKVKNAVIYTAGETISYEKLRQVVRRVTSKNVEGEVWSLEKLREELERDPENSIAKYRLVFAKGKGVSWNPSVTYNVQRGLPATSVEEWASKTWRW